MSLISKKYAFKVKIVNRSRNAERKIEQSAQHRSRRQHAYQVFESNRPKPRFRIKKKNLALTVAIVFLALMVPILFATAANSNEVDKMAQISMSPAPTFSTETQIPAATGGSLTELTEVMVTPTPSPSETLAPSPEPTPSASPSTTAYATITPGTNDPFVAVIQQRLMDLQYMDQDDPTTLYGPVTKQAMEYFQRKNGLPQDGIAGEQAQTVLFSANAKPYTVSEGDSGPDVQSIQDRLVELGYSVDHTGYFGTDTAKAVKYFQRMNGLSADGNIGSNTREMLYSSKAEPSAEYTKAKEEAEKKAKEEEKASASPSKGSSPSSAPAPSAPASSSPKPSASPSAPNTSTKVEAFISAALAQLGRTYVLGGKGPDVFDCSGLVYFALKASDNGIPYMTSYGWTDAGQYARIDSMKDLKRGDVVCETGHVGIYLGDGKIVNASSSNGKVIISENVFNSSYWTGKFICGRRIF